MRTPRDSLPKEDRRKVGETLEGKLVEIAKHGPGDWHIYIGGKLSSRTGWEYVKAFAKAASICAPHH